MNFKSVCMRDSCSVAADELIGRTSSFVFSVSISVSAFCMFGDADFISRREMPRAEVVRLNASPGKYSENHIAVPARVQHFVGLNHRCGTDSEGPSQSPDTIHSSFTARIHKLPEQKKSLHDHEVCDANSVLFAAAQLSTQVPERRAPDGAISVRIRRWTRVIVRHCLRRPQAARMNDLIIVTEMQCPDMRCAQHCRGKVVASAFVNRYLAVVLQGRRAQRICAEVRRVSREMVTVLVIQY